MKFTLTGHEVPEGDLEVGYSSALALTSVPDGMGG